MKTISKVSSSILMVLTLALFSSCGGSGDGSSASSGGGGSSSNKPSGSCSSDIPSTSGTDLGASTTSEGSFGSLTTTESCSKSESLVSKTVNLFSNEKRAAVVFNENWPIEAKTQFNQALAERLISTDCSTYLPEPQQKVEPSCYGPEIYYQYHLDGIVTPSPGNNCSGSDSDAAYCIAPTGDVGIWESLISDGTACSAAKMNSDISYLASFTDISKVISSMAYCLHDEGTISSIPSVGSSIDITTAINNAVLNSDITFSSVTWSATSNVNGDIYSIAMQLSEGQMTSTTQERSDGQYWGTIYGSFSQGSSFISGGVEAFSLRYNTTASGVKYKFMGAQFESSETDYFDANNMVSTSKNWSGNFSRVVAEVNDDGTAIMTYAWQAGQVDDNSRVFNAKLNSETAGVAYFSFGEQMGDSGSSNSGETFGLVSGMICNWALAGNGHDNLGDNLAFQTNEAQKQVLSRSSANDVWGVSSENIDYAPVRSCSNNPAGSRTLDERSDGSATTHAVGPSNFIFGTSEASMAATAVTKDFADVSSGDSGSYDFSSSNPDSPDF